MYPVPAEHTYPGGQGLGHWVVDPRSHTHPAAHFPEHKDVVNPGVLPYVPPGHGVGLSDCEPYGQ